MECPKPTHFFRQPKPVNTLGLEEIHLPGGKKTEQLNVIEPSLGLRATSDTISLPLKDGIKLKMDNQPLKKSKKQFFQKRKKESVTAESPRVPNQMISSDKLSSCSPNIQTLRLSETLEAGLTGNAKVFSNFSEEQLKAISKQLWYPIETDLQGSDLSCSNGSLTITESNSWFSIRRLEVKNPSFAKTCYPLSTCFPVGQTAQDATRNETLQNESKMLETKSQETKILPSKFCQFTITKKIKGIVYGRPCGNVCLEDESVCPKHEEEDECKFEKYWPFTCEFIIKKRGTGVEEERSRKGLPCGEFCKKDERYCRPHSKIASKPKNPILRCIKVRALPTLEQRKILEKWFGDKRKTYNLMVEERLEEKFEERVSIPDKNELEAIYKKKHVTEAIDYLKETPKDIRSNAVEEYFTGVANAFNRYLQRVQTQDWKKKNWKDFRLREIKHPVMRFQRKREQQCIALPSRNSEIGAFAKPKQKHPQRAIKIYPQYLARPILLERRVKKNKTLNRILDTGIQYDFKLLKTKTNKYYFCIPYSAEIQPNNSMKQAACDGGVRNFQTVYSPQGELEQYGYHVSQTIRRYQEGIAKSRYAYFNGPCKGSKQLQERRVHLQEKLKNMVNDLHYKTANSLCKKYGTIILPHYGVASMIRSSKIGPNTKRETLGLAHGEFRRRLISKAELRGCKVLVPQNEFKTTMVCGICFKENLNVGASEVFHCKECGLIAGRDVNSPRDIFIRQLVL
jgi:transposase